MIRLSGLVGIALLAVAGCSSTGAVPDAGVHCTYDGVVYEPGATFGELAE